MLRIYAGTALLSSPVSDTYRTYGDALTAEDNAFDTLTFTILRSHPMSDALTLRTMPITLKDDDVVLFEGRIISMSATATAISVTCESRLACLRDTIMHTYGWTGTLGNLLKYIVETRHKAQAVDGWRCLTVGTVDVASGSIRSESEEPQNTWDCISGLVDEYGGHLILDGSTLHWRASRPQNEQQITFGSNLVDISKHIDATKIVNRIYGFGAKKKEGDSGYKDIDSITDGINGGAVRWTMEGGYVQDSASVEMFGRIATFKVYDKLKTSAALTKQATKDLKASLLSAITINATALDLSLDGRHDRLHLGPVRVVHEGLGIDEMLPITKITYNLKEPDRTRITAGKTRKSLTKRVGGVQTW